MVCNVHTAFAQLGLDARGEYINQVTQTARRAITVGVCLPFFPHRMPLRIVFAFLAALPPRVSAGVQSALDPKGTDAAAILEITWVLFIGGALIFIGVMLLGLIALYGNGPMRAALGRHAWVIGGGILFPVVVLSLLLIYTIMAAAPLVAAQQAATVRVEVIGELWWWRVKYLDQGGNTLLETANEIHIPAGRPVDVLLKSDNVIHSFWVPNLAGKIDMIPGHVNRLRIEATEPGEFRGQCAEYCGAQHARMAFYVVALRPAAFDAWFAAQRQAVPAPDSRFLQEGKQLFLENQCALCHTIRGTSATGTLGPDLSHLGSRLTIGAGLLPLDQGTIAGWITGNQNLKPGNKMPTFNQFSGEELRALSGYLAALKLEPSAAR